MSTPMMLAPSAASRDGVATTLTAGDPGDERDLAVQWTHDPRFHFGTAADKELPRQR